MKKLLCIITLSMFLCVGCGSGMIGLLREDPKTSALLMDNAFDFEWGGHIYTVDVWGYNPGTPIPNCTAIIPNADVAYENLIVYDGKDILNNPYIGQVKLMLHDEYIKLLCGE